MTSLFFDKPLELSVFAVGLSLFPQISLFSIKLLKQLQMYNFIDFRVTFIF